MTKNTMNTIYSVLSNVDFEGKETIMGELDKELHRNDAIKEAKAQTYAQAWKVVKETIQLAGKALTVAEIFESCENELPEGFTKSQVSYGLTHYWNVTKIEGKVNAYALAE